MGSRQGIFQVSTLLLVVFVFSSVVQASVNEDRDRTAKKWAAEIRRAGIHKIYVADFLNSSGRREFGGCYFASVFSTKIASHSNEFEVVNRIRAQKVLAELNISAENLHTPDAVANLSRALGIDGLLLGTVIVSDKEIKITLSLRDVASNKEVRAFEFREPLQPDITGYWPYEAAPTSDAIYFSGLDGVTNPKCIKCPDPAYTEEARRERFQGVVITGVLIAVNGKIEELRVIRDPKNGLAERCLEVIRTWRFEPARDSDGHPVPARVPVETSFLLF